MTVGSNRSVRPSRWSACSSPGCIASGAYGANRDTCLAHLAEDELDVALERCAFEPLDARGVTLDASLLSRILRDARALSRGARFDMATFTGVATFETATFRGDATFDDAKFTDQATFAEATFEGTARFCGTQFVRGATFAGAAFDRSAAFEQTSFHGYAGFGGTRFGGRTDFRDASFKGVAWFGGASFNGPDGAVFDRTRFRGLAAFGRTSFGGPARFREAAFGQDAGFQNARFGGAARFDRATFHGVAACAETRFDDDAVFRDAAFEGRTSFEHSAFARGGQFDAVVFKDVAEFERAAFGRSTSFREATFEGYAGFRETTFERGADFGDTTFNRVAWFGEALFKGHDRGVVFEKARFKRLAGFQQAVFEGAAMVRQARFHDDADFQQATFDAGADFSTVVFHGASRFQQASFGDEARFGGTRFALRAEFDGASFRRSADFAHARFDDAALFQRARFEGGMQFGPAEVGGTLALDSAVSLASLTAEVSAPRVSCYRTRFVEGAALSVAGGEIALEGTQFERPSTVTATPPPAGTKRPEARLVSLRRARVADLAIAGLDLRPCLFTGAHGLDRLWIEGMARFEGTPQAWQRAGRLPWRLAARSAIAEEHRWRIRQANDEEGWNPAQCESEWLNGSDELPDPEELEAGEIAAIYRTLRRAREQSGDRAGAGDFRYGEMELRRHDQSRSSAERAILWLYWCLSGYGLRASRALAALFVTILGFALLLWGVGFDVRPPFPRALLVSIEATVGLFRAPDLGGFSLSDPGEVFEVLLRLSGPVLLGLALLSLGGRVKR